jgi:hypothetical protein
MRASGFVLAMVALLAPSLSYSQNQQMGRTNAPATPELAEARDESARTAAPVRRSLMGMVMDVLIASAEQQSAQEAASMRQQSTTKPSAPPNSAVATPVSAATLSPDLVTREQIAVESEP